MKKGNIFTLVMVLFLFSLTFVSSAPPVQTNVNTEIGIQIFYPAYEVVEINQPFFLHIHVSNITTGKEINADAIDCYLHLYNETGYHQLEMNLTDDSNNIDSELYITEGNFSTLGERAFRIYCSTDGIGGEAGGTFMVTRTGNMLTTSEALIYIVLAFGVLLLFALSFFFLIVTPYANKVNDKGAVIQITKLKYVKLALVLLTWVLFTWFLNILIGLSDAFVSLTMYYGFFGFMFDVMNRLALPLGIVIFVMGIFEIIKDADLYGNIKKFGSAS